MDTNELEILEVIDQRSPKQSHEHIKAIMAQESEDFLAYHFHKEHELLALYIRLFKEHSLDVPYSDHLRRKELLGKIYNLLCVSDPEFASTSLRKLHRSIQNLQSAYALFSKNNGDTTKVFAKLFKNHSELSLILKARINEIKRKKPLSELMQNELAVLQQDLRELSLHYKEYFQPLYEEERLYIERSFKELLNALLYYFEALMWDEAALSVKISQKFAMLGLLGLGTKEYIEYRLKRLSPNETEYSVLKKIYRSYR